MIVIILLAYGCPIQAIVHAFELDERTVADWRYRAGKHCKMVHKDQIERRDIDLQHVQADEIRVKARGSILYTSSIERFNGTIRERLASLTRKCRHASAKIEAFH